MNIINPSMVVTSDAVTSGSFNKENINDGSFSTSFVQSGTLAAKITIDLGATFEVKSLLLTQYIPTDFTSINVYIG